MKINPIQNNQQNFKASIAPTVAVRDTVRYMSEHRMRPDCTDWTIEHYLWNKIEYAMLRHPSPNKIYTSVKAFKNNPMQNKGVIRSCKSSMRSSNNSAFSTVVPVLNIWKDFLNPENKDKFNKIVGKEYEKDYPAWWENNIKPFWNDISKRFEA